MPKTVPKREDLRLKRTLLELRGAETGKIKVLKISAEMVYIQLLLLRQFMILNGFVLTVFQHEEWMMVLFYKTALLYDFIAMNRKLMILQQYQNHMQQHAKFKMIMFNCIKFCFDVYTIDIWDTISVKVTFTAPRPKHVEDYLLKVAMYSYPDREFEIKRSNE